MAGSYAGLLSVMMPIYNEQETLEVILRNVLQRPEVGEVIAVDDGSTDASWEILTEIAAKDPRVRAFRQASNQGKGSALRMAIGKITRPYALVQDSDLEYDPVDYPVLLAPLVEGRTDVVYGVRGFVGQTAYSFWFVLGNKVVTMACNILFDVYISDLETGYKALRSELWRRLALRGNRFEIEPDITGRVLRLGYRIHEVPIHYYARSREEGKKITWQDGIKAVLFLGKMRMTSDGRLFGKVRDRDYHRQRLAELAKFHPLLTGPGEKGGPAY